MKKKLFGKPEAPTKIAEGVFAMPALSAIATIKKASSTGKNAEMQTTPNVTIEKLNGNADDAVNWGLDNQFPNNWELEIENNDTLTDAIEKEVDRIVAGGIDYYYIDIAPDGTKLVKYFYDEEIEDLLTSAASLTTFEQMIYDYIKHRMPLPQLLFDAAKTKCIGLAPIPATHARWSKQDNQGFINFVYYNSNWTLGRKSDSPDTIKIPLIDPLIDTVDIIRAEPNILKYAFRVPIASHRTYYPLAPAYSALTSLWLPITNKVAKYFAYSLDNQMSPKYHIEIDEEWIAKKYGDRWNNATPKIMNEIFLEELTHFNSMMHGAVNAGKNLMTAKSVNSVIMKEYSMWKITELKGTVFEQGWIELLKEGVLHIVKAVGLDPSTHGGNSTSGMGAGSGSDKREAFNITMATVNRHVEKILLPFYFAINYNGKKAPNGTPIKLKMITPSLQTLNNVTPSQRETALPTQKK